MAQGKKFFRKVHRADANQPKLFRYVRDFGVAARSLTQVGNGCPDSLMALRAPHAVNVLVEIKNRHAKGGAELRKEQEAFLRDWPGPVVIAETGEQALKAVLAYSAAAHPEWLGLARRILKSWDGVKADEIEQLSLAMRGYLAPAAPVVAGAGLEPGNVGLW